MSGEYRMNIQGHGEDGEKDTSEHEKDTSEKDSGEDGGEEELLIPEAKQQCGGSGTVFLILLTVVAALGGFLFGYDTGVVSGAMLLVSEHFGLDSVWHEYIVSATLVAAAVAAAFGGPLCDLFGRKPVLLLASIVFTIGAVVMGVAQYAWMLLIGRVIVGIGIGFAAMAVPMYIAESAPADMRGKLVVVNILFITGGQFIATVVDGVFSYLPIAIGWRFMFALAGVPSLIMLIGFIFMPETPRWLVFHNKSEKARHVLSKLRPSKDVEGELQAIVEDYEEYKKQQMGFIELAKRFLTSRTVLLALFVGCGLQLFQQFGGINTVMYYSASIIQMAGFSDQQAIWLATIPGFGNFVFTIVGLLLVDRIGRRKLLIGSMSGVIFGFLILTGTFVLMDHYSPRARSLYSNGTCDFDSCGACVGNSECGFCVDYDPAGKEYFNGTCNLGGSTVKGRNVHYYSYFRSNDSNETCGVYGDLPEKSSIELGQMMVGSGEVLPTLERSWHFNGCPNNRFAVLAIIALFIYIAFFAPGMGPLPWTVNSEIYPTWARSTGIAIATSVNWLSNLVVSMTFLTLADTLGQPGTFGLYAGLGFIGLLFIIFFVPETKGKRLEEVETLFKRPYCFQWCTSS